MRSIRSAGFAFLRGGTRRSVVFPWAVCNVSAMEKSQLPPQAIKSNRIIGKIRAREIFVVVSNNFYRARPNRAARFRVAVHASAHDLSRNLRCNGAQFRYQPQTRAPVELKLQSAGRTKKKKKKTVENENEQTNAYMEIYYIIQKCEGNSIGRGEVWENCRVYRV